MSHRAPFPFSRSAPRLAFGLALLSALAACGTQSTTRYTAVHQHYRPGRYYPPPGPANDPWGPYIREASHRFDMPEQWIRAVMRQESGGQEDVISWAGAMGLMQVMPETYDELRDRYGLGDDPFNPHNNILAGTAYLREMYDRYGSPGFLAAYNAGPNRVDRYLTAGMPLPAETVSYVASIAPRLGNGAPVSGPLTVYAGNSRFGGGSPVRLAAARIPGGCDPDAAYDPDRPCQPLAPASVQPAVLATVRSPTPADCDPDAAYDPDRPCQLRPAPVAVAAAEPPAGPVVAEPLPSRSLVAAGPLEEPARVPYQPTYQPPPVPRASPRPQYAANDLPARTPRAYRSARPIQETMAQPVAYRTIVPPTYTPPPQPPARWAIEVGAYPTLAAAETAADSALARLSPSRRTKTELLPTAPLGSHVAFRARIMGLTESEAKEACVRVGHTQPCMTVAPQETF